MAARPACLLAEHTESVTTARHPLPCDSTALYPFRSMTAPSTRSSPPLSHPTPEPPLWEMEPPSMIPTAPSPRTITPHHPFAATWHSRSTQSLARYTSTESPISWLSPAHPVTLTPSSRHPSADSSTEHTRCAVFPSDSRLLTWLPLFTSAPFRSTSPGRRSRSARAPRTTCPPRSTPAAPSASRSSCSSAMVTPGGAAVRPPGAGAGDGAAGGGAAGGGGGGPRGDGAAGPAGPPGGERGEGPAGGDEAGDGGTSSEVTAPSSMGGVGARGWGASRSAHRPAARRNPAGERREGEGCRTLARRGLLGPGCRFPGSSLTEQVHEGRQLGILDSLRGVHCTRVSERAGSGAPRGEEALRGDGARVARGRRPRVRVASLGSDIN